MNKQKAQSCLIFERKPPGSLFKTEGKTILFDKMVMDIRYIHLVKWLKKIEYTYGEKARSRNIWRKIWRSTWHVLVVEETGETKWEETLRTTMLKNCNSKYILEIYFNYKGSFLITTYLDVIM